MRVGMALHQSLVGQRPDPAQGRGRRYGSRDAKARYRYALLLQPRRQQVEQHVPGGIGEQVARQEIGADAPRAQQRLEAAHALRRGEVSLAATLIDCGAPGPRVLKDIGKLPDDVLRHVAAFLPDEGADGAFDAERCARLGRPYTAAAASLQPARAWSPTRASSRAPAAI